MTFGSLFSGIGGIDLGLTRAGFECRWQAECDPYARKVLARHWPDAIRFRDVREASAMTAPRVDLIAGGFPCQDISGAGTRKGLDGERSGLWSEFARVIRDLRPLFVVVENVARLRSAGLDRVLGDLAACGFDAEWDCIPACAVGAPHIRDRVFLVATLAHPDGDGFAWGGEAHDNGGAITHGNDSCGCGAIFCRIDFERYAERSRASWATESGVRRVVDGVPDRVDRLRGLGNAVVPQIAEWIGRRIMTMVRRR